MEIPNARGAGKIKMETKTDKQITYYISDKIWNWKTKEYEDLKDIIQEALKLKQDQILKIVDEFRKRQYYEHDINECGCCEKSLDSIVEIMKRLNTTGGTSQ